MTSNLFGTFLFNCERERVEAGLKDKTQSLWDLVNREVGSEELFLTCTCAM